MAHFYYRWVEKSSGAQHVLETKYRIDMYNLILIWKVCSKGTLDAFESLEIFKCKKVTIISCCYHQLSW